MDYRTFTCIKSLIETLKDPKYANYKKAFIKMATKLKKRKKKPKEKVHGKHKTKIRKYFGLLSLWDWWYLVFRTINGKGAYLFLRLIKDHPTILDVTVLTDQQLWDYIVNLNNWDQAEEDFNDDEVPDPDPEEPVTNEAENDIGPLPFPPPGGGW